MVLRARQVECLQARYLQLVASGNDRGSIFLQGELLMAVPSLKDLLVPLGKLVRLLRPEQRRDAWFLLGLMVIGMGFETLGVGLVIPALALLTQADLLANYPALAPLVVFLGNPDPASLLVIGMGVLVAVYGAKSVFLAFLVWRQAGFVFDLQAGLSQSLFKVYLSQPYTFHLQRNSAQLIRNAIGQVSDVTNVVQQGMMFLTELLVMIGILILLIYVEPLGALLALGTLGGAVLGFGYLTRGYLQRWGVARQLHEGLRIQHLQQGLGGAKDVILLGRGGNFLLQYEEHNQGTARVGKRQMVLQALPRLWLEFLAIVGLSTIVFVSLAQGKPMALLLPTVGLFAAAAFRITPSINRLLIAVQNVRYSLPAIENLCAELKLGGELPNAEPKRDSMAFRNELKLSAVTFSYPEASKPSLQDVVVSISCGSSVGIIGGSGAGKSTLVDLLLGLLEPGSGKVTVDGIDIRCSLRAWQDQIGYVPQSVFLTDDTLRRNVAFGLSEGQIDDEAVWRALSAAQMEEFVRSLPDGLETTVGERGINISGGQRQRIGIARALYHDPAVLVLDEATSSLDVHTEAKIMDAVQSLHGEKTIVIVAHRLSTVEHCDQIYRLESGKVVEVGSASAVLRKTDISVDGA